MSKLGCLLLIWAICEVISAEDKQNKNSFVQPLDFAPIFESGASLSSNPLSAAIINVDKSKYAQLFDTVVSSSIDSLQTRVAPRDHFSAETFGFNPIASSSFYPAGQSAKLVARGRSPPPQPQPQPARLREQSPLQYDIRTVHDADYKVYKPEENDQQQILSALKTNPAVAAYFKPATTHIEVAHPIKYRTEDSIEDPEVIEQNYKPNAYITGPPRIRRYTHGKKKKNVRRHDDDEEEDDPYNYKAEYVSRPKAFDSGAYSSAYKEEKDPNKDYEYPYGDYDSGYDHKEYERIKDLSEKQAAEIKQNPQNCKEVLKDGMNCVTCKDPKTGGNYESCSYVAEPKNNKYAYSKEKKFDSKDQPDEPESDEKPETSKSPAKYEESKSDDSSKEHEAPSSGESSKPYSNYQKAPEDEGDNSGDKYKGYYVHTSKPKQSEALRASSEEDEASEEKPDDDKKSYNYKKSLPGFYTDNAPKKDVEHVLAEFKKKDRSACKKVQKNGMTCFQCIDKTGLKHEECMFVSESAPKRSHLAYQEVKEFTSKPATLDNGGNEEAESQTVTTSAPAPLAKSAAYVVANNGYGKKLKRKKAARASPASAASAPVAKEVAPFEAVPTQQPFRSRKVKRSEESEAEARAEIVDETNIAAPEEFAGANSKGAFWAETMPRYSAALGVTLPEYMLARSEHEASFDEAVAGA